MEVLISAAISSPTYDKLAHGHGYVDSFASSFFFPVARKATTAMLVFL